MTGSRDHDSIVFDAATGAFLYLLRIHGGTVTDAQFSPDSRWIVTAGPRKVGLWSAATGKFVRAPERPGIDADGGSIHPRQPRDRDTGEERRCPAGRLQHLWRNRRAAPAGAGAARGDEAGSHRRGAPPVRRLVAPPTAREREAARRRVAARVDCPDFDGADVPECPSRRDHGRGRSGSARGIPRGCSGGSRSRTAGCRGSPSGIVHRTSTAVRQTRDPFGRHCSTAGVTGLSCHGAAIGIGVVSYASTTRSKVPEDGVAARVRATTLDAEALHAAVEWYRHTAPARPRAAG